MKRSLIFIIAGLLIFCPVCVFAAGTMTVTNIQKITVGGSIQRVVVTLTCTGDSSDGTFPDFTFTPKTYGVEGWYLYSAETNPGTTGPTAAYDILIWNTDKSFDLAGSLLTNRSASNTEKVYLGSVGYPIADSNWVVSISNNSVHSAVVVLKLTLTAN